MSRWTYISGVIEVSPLGRSQAELRYILDTVLSHLPKVTGSEGNMNTYTIQKNGYNHSSSTDEFGQFSNLSTGYCDTFEMQNDYLVIVNASLRDREFEETLKQFTKWICRLAKRVWVDDVLVRVSCSDGKEYLFSDSTAFTHMFECPSWVNDCNEPNWCEFLMWDNAKGSDYPMMLGYKYISDKENDAEVERRLQYLRGN